MTAPGVGEAVVGDLLTRAGVYRLLAAAFAYPEPAGLAAVAALAAGASAPEIRGALDDLARAAGEADAAALAQEYVFLFDRGARCPPYEGAWGDGPQLAGKAALLADIAGFYAAFGLRPSEAQPEMEDHVAVECEFMSALCLKQAYALAQGEDEGHDVTRRAAAAFVAEHLGRWTPAFAAALRDATPLSYWGAVAGVLEAWTAAETVRLAVEPARVAGRVGHDPVQDEESFSCPMVAPVANDGNER